MYNNYYRIVNKISPNCHAIQDENWKIFNKNQTPNHIIKTNINVSSNSFIKKNENNTPIGQSEPTGQQNSIAEFYAIMPEDNPATIAPGSNILFPRNGPSLGLIVSRINTSSFQLSNIGVYQVFFQASIIEPGQLCITINNIVQPQTVVERATGTSQIVGNSLIETTISNSILSICNPAGETTDLSLTLIAGGNNAVSANIIICFLG